MPCGGGGGFCHIPRYLTLYCYVDFYNAVIGRNGKLIAMQHCTLSSKLLSSQSRMQFKQLLIEAWKSQDFNGVWTRDLTIPVWRSNQLRYEATDIWWRSFVRSIGNCLNCVHNGEDHNLLDFKSAVQYMKHFIYHFTLYTLLTISRKADKK